MNKIIFILILLISYTEIFCQSAKDTLSLPERYERRIQEEGRKRRKEILQNFEDVEYNNLIKLIVKDIDFTKLKENNLVFYFNSNCILTRDYGYGTILFNKHICETDGQNPAFNQINFWSLENIHFIQKKYKKNMIPFLELINDFVTDGDDFETFDEKIEYTYFDDSKVLIDDVKKELKGTYKERDKTTQFYFFPINNKSKELTLTKLNDVKNYNTLFLSFINYVDKIIAVKFAYDYPDNQKVYYQAYQFKNNKWIKVPYPKGED